MENIEKSGINKKPQGLRPQGESILSLSSKHTREALPLYPLHRPRVIFLIDSTSHPTLRRVSGTLPPVFLQPHLSRQNGSCHACLPPIFPPSFSNDKGTKNPGVATTTPRAPWTRRTPGKCEQMRVRPSECDGYSQNFFQLHITSQLEFRIFSRLFMSNNFELPPYPQYIHFVVWVPESAIPDAVY